MLTELHTVNATETVLRPNKGQAGTIQKGGQSGMSTSVVCTSHRAANANWGRKELTRNYQTIGEKYFCWDLGHTPKKLLLAM